MKAEDLKGKTFDELSKMLLDLKKEQFNLRFQRSQGQLEKTDRVGKVRRDIARVKTFMTQVKEGDKTGATKAAKSAAKAAPKKKAATSKKDDKKVA
jgi:large subunit ribosomal protein L29